MATNASEVQTPDFLAGLGNLTLIRQIGLMLGLAGAVALGVWVVMWSQEPSWRPLLRDVHTMDANEVTSILTSQQIRYKIDTNGALLVDESGFHKARIALAGAGITDSRDLGFEILQQDSGFGTSQFMENARYLRSIEGELARTITSFRQVRGARVHLAVPRQSVFVRDRRPPSASVFLELGGGTPMTTGQIQAVVNLVANSVPDLTPDAVSVVDQRGRLLSAETNDPGVQMAARQLKYQQEVEERLRLRIESLLNRIVGPDRYRTELTVDMDFTQVETAVESFDPTTAAVRSQRVLSEGGASTSNVGGVPGALSNQATEPAEEGEEGGEAPIAQTVAQQFSQGIQTGDNGKYEEVKNFELERQMTYRRGQQGRIVRMSVAVAVDDIVSVDPDTGEQNRESWTAADLERLGRLVREAVGVTDARGDTLSIENTPFAELPDEFEAFELPIWQQPWAVNLAKQAAGALFVLFLVFGVLRPLFKRVTEVGGQTGFMVPGGPNGEMVAAGAGGAAGGAGGSDGGLLGLPGPGGTAGEPDVDLPGRNAGYEKQLDAIRNLVAEDPGRVAQVIREWVAEE